MKDHYNSIRNSKASLFALPKAEAGILLILYWYWYLPGMYTPGFSISGSYYYIFWVNTALKELKTKMKDHYNSIRNSKAPLFALPKAEAGILLILFKRWSCNLLLLANDYFPIPIQKETMSFLLHILWRYNKFQLAKTWPKL